MDYDESHDAASGYAGNFLASNSVQYTPTFAYHQDENSNHGSSWPFSGYQAQHLPPLAGMQTVHVGPDLEGVTADKAAVAAMDPSNLTRGVHDQPWFITDTGHVGKLRTASDPVLLNHMSQSMGNSNGDVIDSAFSSVQLSPVFANPTHPRQRALSQHSSGFAVPVMLQSSLTTTKSSRPKVKSPTATASVASSRRRSSFVATACELEGCKKQFLSRSDRTKHMNQHIKPYMCTVSGCPRSTEGFGTPNDARRHMRDKHKIRSANDEGYICQACPPDDGESKWWPRKDNFKAHIKRKHPNADKEELIRLSFQSQRPDDAISDIGTAFSGQPYNYYEQSQPDSEPFYHYDHTFASMSQPSAVLQNQAHYQGEMPLWKASVDLVIQSDELADLDVARQADHNFPSHRHVGSCRPSGPNPDSAIRQRHQHAGNAILPCYVLDKPLTSNPPCQGEDSLSPADRGCGSAGTKGNLQAARMTRRTACVASDMLRRRQKKTMQKRQRKSRVVAAGIRIVCHCCFKEHKTMSLYKKHLMRHERPFECTHITCFFSAGSKDDWKRHETKLHKVPEGWLCTLPHPEGAGVLCNTYFDTHEWFRQHLAGPKHYTPAAAIETLIDEMRLGKAGRTRFWCGYCREVVPNPETDEKQIWDYRCRHIGAHWDDVNRAEKQSWTCVFVQKPRREFSRMLRQQIKDGKIRPGCDDPYSAEQAFQDQMDREEMRMRAGLRYSGE